MQAYYFVGRISGTVAETMWWGRRYRAYQEAVPGGADRGKPSFEDWSNASGNEGDCHVGRPMRTRANGYGLGT